jgi:hypothetical protein
MQETNCMAHWPGDNNVDCRYSFRSQTDRRDERRYTKKQAEIFFKAILNELPDVPSGDRHRWLVRKTIGIGNGFGKNY